MNARFFDFAKNIPKLEHFEGVGFRRWQKKMKFLLAALEATRRRMKWENDDLACRGHILNGMSDTLFDIYQYEESSKNPWDVLEAKYISEDASSKKFLVSEFNEFKMEDNRPVMEQFHEIVRILGLIRQHGMNMDDSIAIASIIDKLPPSWKKLGTHLYVEEGIRHKEKKSKMSAKVTGASSSSIVKASQNRKGKGKSGKVTKFSKFKKNVKGKGKASVVCWVCNGPHFKKDCEVWRRRVAQLEGKTSSEIGQGSGQWKQGNIVNLVLDSTDMFIAMISEICVMQTDDSWWIDTGATRHVCRTKDLIPSSSESKDDDQVYDHAVSKDPELRKSKRFNDSRKTYVSKRQRRFMSRSSKLLFTWKLFNLKFENMVISWFPRKIKSL
nr:zinc finger, CCHC-type [Ipomoea batatas]